MNPAKTRYSVPRGLSPCKLVSSVGFTRAPESGERPAGRGTVLPPGGVFCSSESPGRSPAHALFRLAGLSVDLGLSRLAACPHPAPATDPTTGRDVRVWEPCRRARNLKCTFRHVLLTGAGWPCVGPGVSSSPGFQRMVLSCGNRFRHRPLAKAHTLPLAPWAAGGVRREEGPGGGSNPVCGSNRPGHRPACPGQTPRRPLPHADAGVDPPEPHGLRRQLTGSPWQDVGSRRCPRTLKSQAQGARELGALRAPRGAAAAGGPSPATFASVHFGLDSGEGNEVSLARAMCSPQPEEGPS